MIYYPDQQMHIIRGVTQKFPEFLNKLFKVFEVLTLLLDAAIPAPLPTEML
jgi:hypothetical protein